jgi:hypothetical protein
MALHPALFVIGLDAVSHRLAVEIGLAVHRSGMVNVYAHVHYLLNIIAALTGGWVNSASRLGP